jgi:hypothetical protein
MQLDPSSPTSLTPRYSLVRLILSQWLWQDRTYGKIQPPGNTALHLIPSSLNLQATFLVAPIYSNHQPKFPKMIYATVAKSTYQTMLASRVSNAGRCPAGSSLARDVYNRPILRLLHGRQHRPHHLRRYCKIYANDPVPFFIRHGVRAGEGVHYARNVGEDANTGAGTC